MSEEPEKKKTNRKRPDTSGRKKTKEYKKRTFSLSMPVNELLDSLPSEPKGYLTAWVEVALLQHAVRHQIIMEAAQALNRLLPNHHVTSLLNSYDDTLEDSEVLEFLREFNGK